MPKAKKRNGFKGKNDKNKPHLSAATVNSLADYVQLESGGTTIAAANNGNVDDDVNTHLSPHRSPLTHTRRIMCSPQMISRGVIIGGSSFRKMARMSAEASSNHNRGAIISSPSKRPLVIEKHQDHLSHGPWCALSPMQYSWPKMTH